MNKEQQKERGYTQNEIGTLRSYKHGELAKEILKGLAIGGFIIACFAIPNLAQVVTLFDPKHGREKYKIRRTIESLAKRKLVTVTEQGKNTLIKITERGRQRVVKFNLDEMELTRPKKWDGLWRIIIFDIPEKKKRIRDEINFRLKGMGFEPVQKSTFITPFPCKKEIDFLGEYFYIRDNVKYILAREIDGEDELKEKWDL